LQVDANWCQQCYLWKDLISRRSGFGDAATGLVRLYSVIGCLYIPAGDNAADILCHHSPQPFQVLLEAGSSHSDGLCYRVNVSNSSLPLLTHLHSWYVMFLIHIHATDIRCFRYQQRYFQIVFYSTQGSHYLKTDSMFDKGIIMREASFKLSQYHYFYYCNKFQITKFSARHFDFGGMKQVNNLVYY